MRSRYHDETRRDVLGLPSKTRYLGLPSGSVSASSEPFRPGQVYRILSHGNQMSNTELKRSAMRPLAVDLYLRN